jgi:hypothetical protein
MAAELDLKQELLALHNFEITIIQNQFECCINSIATVEQLLANNKKRYALIPDPFWLLQYCAMPPLEPEHAFNDQNEFYTNTVLGLCDNSLDENFGITFKLTNNPFLIAILKRLQDVLICTIIK